MAHDSHDNRGNFAADKKRNVTSAYKQGKKNIIFRQNYESTKIPTSPAWHRKKTIHIMKKPERRRNTWLNNIRQ